MEVNVLIGPLSATDFGLSIPWNVLDGINPVLWRRLARSG
jgi:hypothetical protein